MDQLREWGAIVTASLNAFTAAVAELLPRLFGALLLFLLGWLLARLLRALTRKLIAFLDKLLQRFALSASTEYRRLHQMTSTVLAGFVFWLVIIVFLAAAANVLQLAIFSRWFDALILYLPRVLAGGIIMLAGIVFGSAVRTMVGQAARSARFHQSELLSRLAQFAVIVSAVVIGLGQLGIDVSFITDLFVVASAAVLGAFALGVALASPVHVSNLISVRTIRRSYHEGDEIVLGEYRGRILAITQSAVVLETEQGETTLPAKLFAEQPITKVVPKDAGG